MHSSVDQTETAVDAIQGHGQTADALLGNP